MSVQLNSRSIRVGLAYVFLLILSVFSLLLHAQPSPNSLFIIKPLPPRVLTLYSLPVQQSQVNTDFYFGLRKFVSVIEPVVDYLITNDWDYYLDVYVQPLPAGITQDFSEGDSCNGLYPNQSCRVHFRFNRNIETYWVIGPVACPSTSDFLCSITEDPWIIARVIPFIASPTEIKVTPLSQDGLSYDPSTYSIVGKPTRVGRYFFTINASNDRTIAEPRQLQINVGIDPKDTPVFKTDYPIADATADKDYRLDLMTLVEPVKGFMVNNQIHFRIDASQSHPSWLSIDKNNPSLLMGHVPQSEAGKILDVTLIASSNTGGDSEVLTIQIPVAYDPEMKPRFRNAVELYGRASVNFQKDFRNEIIDPANDRSLKLVIDKIEPMAPWLSISPSNPTELSGFAPRESVGNYQLFLHASTATGGSSDTIMIPLKIDINKELTPRFNSLPNFPYLQAGQSFEYDFVANRTIYPEYNSIPYTIELAKDSTNQTWARIEDNKLIIDQFPSTNKQSKSIDITIKNIPGGMSQETLTFYRE